MLVFGGMDDGGRWHNDLWEVNLNDLHWFSLKGIASGAPPKPRAYHSYALQAPACVYMTSSGCVQHLSEQLGFQVPREDGSLYARQAVGCCGCLLKGHVCCDTTQCGAVERSS